MTAPLQPRNLGELTDAAIELWRPSAWRMFRFMLPIQLVLFAASRGYLIVVGGGGNDPAFMMEHLGRFILATAVFTIVVTVGMFVYLHQQAVVARVLGTTVLGTRGPGVGESLREAHAHLWAKKGGLIGAVFLFSGLWLAVSTGLILVSAVILGALIGVAAVFGSSGARPEGLAQTIAIAAVGGAALGPLLAAFWVALRAFVWLPAFVMEERVPFRRVGELLKGRASSGFGQGFGMRTAVVMTAIGFVAQSAPLICVLPSWIVTAYFGFAQGRADPKIPLSLSTPLEFLAVIGGTLFTNLWMSAAIQFYLDLRARKEGIDLQLSLAKLPGTRA